MSLREKLAEYIIDKLDEKGHKKTNSKWNEKALNCDDEEIEVTPLSLNGEILLGIDIDENGRIKGWETISVEDMEGVLNRRDNPNNRRDEAIERGKFTGRNRRSLSSSEFEEHTGYKGWLDKWRQEGIDI